jgi:hypothetical protein
MNDNYNYPEGADNSDAPWYEKENEPVEVEVTVSLTLSKRVKIYTTDYEKVLEKDEDDIPFVNINLENCNLKKAVEEQIMLPQNAYRIMPPETKVCKDLSNWNVDDFEVIKDD